MLKLYALDMWMNYGTAGAWILSWIVIGMFVWIVITGVTLAVDDIDFSLDDDEFLSDIGWAFTAGVIWPLIISVALVAAVLIGPMYLVYLTANVFLKHFNFKK